MKKLLLISYFYPPLGGPGVQRPLKLIRYLLNFGWETDVITVKDIVFHSFDKQLEKENKARNVYKIGSYDLMSFLKKTSPEMGKRTRNIYFRTPEGIKKIIRNSFPIDDKIGWLPRVLKEVKSIAPKNNYDAVMATMGPYTSGIIAYKISQKYNLPLFIDYRDHWTLNPYIKHLTFLHKLQAEKWEGRILKKAKAVSVIGQTLKNDLVRKFGDEIRQKTTVMYNGWDEMDFSKKYNSKNSKIILRYIGNFYGHRSVKYFIKALENLEENLLTKLEIEFVGNYYQSTLEMINSSKVKEQLKILNQINHSEAVKLMLTSDILLLFIASPNGQGVLTGKIFEYIRACKPILAMIPPNGEAASILRKQGHEYICAMEDTESITENLKKMINLAENDRFPNFQFDSELNRENQTKKFVKFLEEQ